MNKQGKLFTYRLTLPAGNLYAQQLHKHPGFKGRDSLIARLRRDDYIWRGNYPISIVYMVRLPGEFRNGLQLWME